MKIGEAEHHGPEMHGVYIGPDSKLKGKTALLMASGDEIAAQFDDCETGLGYGWHPFKKEEFHVTTTY